VRAFVNATFQGRPFVVFQWRTETVKASMLPSCARQLAAVAARLPSISAAGPASALLVTEMPAPSRNETMWGVYRGGVGPSQRKAVAALLAVGMVKYDAVHSGTEIGVLSIRERLLAQAAPAYVTCHDTQRGDCRGCFRTKSKFVERVLRVRKAAGKPSCSNWWALEAAAGSVGGPADPSGSAEASASSAAPPHPPDSGAQQCAIDLHGPAIGAAAVATSPARPTEPTRAD
jgi:hypothetical protein